MQFRLLPALFIFFGSYFPLAVILALQDVKKEYWDLEICWRLNNCVIPRVNNPFMSLSLVALTFLCVLTTVWILKNVRYKYPVHVSKFKSISSELISYSFPYIVSLIGVGYDDSGKIVGLIIFLLMLFLITYRAGYIIMNPLLIILGWNLYEAEVKVNKKNRVVKILYKGDLSSGMHLCENIQGNYISMNKNGVS